MSGGVENSRTSIFYASFGLWKSSTKKVACLVHKNQKQCVLVFGCFVVVFVFVFVVVEVVAVVVGAAAAAAVVVVVFVVDVVVDVPVNNIDTILVKDIVGQISLHQLHIQRIENLDKLCRDLKIIYLQVSFI